MRRHVEDLDDDAAAGARGPGDRAMTSAELKALRIINLHFCLTMPRLIDFGVKSTTVRRLEAAGFVEVTNEAYANPPGLVVTWVKITDDGKRELARH